MKRFLKSTGAQIPMIMGPMYPCSNPELVGAGARAGIVSVFQPLSLTFVHGHDFEEGVRLMQSLAGPNKHLLGMNCLIEKSSKKYLKKQEEWLDLSLDLGVRFFITSLGNPDWVVKKVHKKGGLVYHDATNAHWGRKAVDAGVDGLVGVNNLAGGHAGDLAPQALLDELAPFNLPVVNAGGVGDPESFARIMKMRSGAGDSGFAACQLGTRFIAAQECSASKEYKDAIVQANAGDVTLTKALTGVNVSVIGGGGSNDRLPAVLSWMLNNPSTKHFARTILSVRSVLQLKKSHSASKSLWQAGKSVETIHSVKSVEEIVNEFSSAIEHGNL